MDYIANPYVLLGLGALGFYIMGYKGIATLIIVGTVVYLAYNMWGGRTQ